MVRYLIQKPLAVIMVFITLLITGIVLMTKVPVSLLPNVDVPRMVVRISYPNTPAMVIEEKIMESVRESLVNLTNLKTIESKSADHNGLLYLTFEYGTRMDLAYIEVNEKIDRLSPALPRDMPRPQVIRVNTADIPIVRIQVIPREGTDYMEVTDLAEKVLKKRLEQLQGVSLVDINGKAHSMISVTPDRGLMHAMGLDDEVITQTIKNANSDIGGLSVKDGQYRYFIKLINKTDNESAIAELPIKLKNGAVVRLSRIAKIERVPENQTGYHLYNGKEGLVITVQKQPGSRMNELMPDIEKLLALFRNDYPQVTFYCTQDQTFLLDAGISNLYQDLLYGGILTIALLFLFLGNWASPLLMGISIPLSLIITFIFFYLFGISFNIISLSGLALGIGMLIDNSIVVIDSITRKRQLGMDVMASSVDGTNEVIAPVISQVLTTVAVYAPLILLSGMGGALIFDQSTALTISLAVSLLVAFVLSPLLYKLFLKASPEALKKDPVFYKWVSNGYHRMIHHILQHKIIYFVLTIALMPAGFLFARWIPVSSLPQIEKKESLVYIDWNEPIDAGENLLRTKRLHLYIQPSCIVTEAEVGIKQFLLQQENNTIQQSEIYFSCNNEQQKLNTDQKLKKWLARYYPAASYSIMDAPNAFTQLFATTTPYLEARFAPLRRDEPFTDTHRRLQSCLKQMPGSDYTQGEGMMTEASYEVVLDDAKMSLYGISKLSVEETMKQEFGAYNMAEIKRFGEVKTIRLETDNQTLESKMQATVAGNNDNLYPLNSFTTLHKSLQPRFITAGRSGVFQSVIFRQNTKDPEKLIKQIAQLAPQNGLTVNFTGSYFEDKQQVSQLWIIFLLVLLLLYFILAIQYEDLIQPVIVMLTIPLGISGGMFLLWITGSTLDVMSGIGFIVILGLIVDDPVLKIETLNRLEKKYLLEGRSFDEKMLEKMIHEAGEICLKPLLMVSLTTSIALVPVLLVNGIGNDLQKPLAIVIIGGLTIGTFFTTWFVPLAYCYLTMWKIKRRQKTAVPI